MKLKTPTFPRKGHHDSTAAPVPPVPIHYAPPSPQVPAAPAAAAASTTATALKKATGGLTGPTRQRNAAAMFAGLAFIVIAGAIGASVASSFDDSIDVLVAASDIVEGQPIRATDFRVVQIAAAAGDIQAVAPSSIDDLVGRVAAGPIGQGSMIHPDQFAQAYEDQQIIIGAALGPDQYPAGGLKAGDQVRVIALSGSSGRSDKDDFITGQEVAIAEIADVVVLGSSSLHFSMRVPESSANAVAQLIALDRISLGLLDQSIEIDSVAPLTAADPVAPLTLEVEPAE